MDREVRESCSTFEKSYKTQVKQISKENYLEFVA